MAFSMTDRTRFIWQPYPAHVTSWVCSCTLAVWWGRSKDIPQKETSDAQAPRIHSTCAAHVSEALQKGDMNSFGSLHLLLSCSHRAMGMPVLRPLDGCTFSHVTARDYGASKKVAGSKMSKSFKIPEGQWLGRSLQKTILTSLQIIKWTWITDAVCCKNC